jgi:hypothetical protein
MWQALGPSIMNTDIMKLQQYFYYDELLQAGEYSRFSYRIGEISSEGQCQYLTDGPELSHTPQDVLLAALQSLWQLPKDALSPLLQHLDEFYQETMDNDPLFIYSSTVNPTPDVEEVRAFVQNVRDIEEAAKAQRLIVELNVYPHELGMYLETVKDERGTNAYSVLSECNPDTTWDILSPESFPCNAHNVRHILDNYVRLEDTLEQVGLEFVIGDVCAAYILGYGYQGEYNMRDLEAVNGFDWRDKQDWRDQDLCLVVADLCNHYETYERMPERSRRVCWGMAE